MSSKQIKFAYWVPNVSGGLVVSAIEQRTSWDIDYNRKLAQMGASSPELEGNWAKSTFEDLVQYNDGFKTNLIGTPQQIAERIVELKAVGVDLILSGFLHFQEEVAYFGEKVLPLVRELEAQKKVAAAA